MLDSGVAGNYIEPFFLYTLWTGHIHYTTMDITLQLGALHTDLTHSPHNPVILGLPVLQPNPLISWREQQISCWDNPSPSLCLQ